MLKKRLFAMLTLIVGVMLVFALSGCRDEPPPPPAPHWESRADIPPIDGTWSGNTVAFIYNGSAGTLTRNGGGNTLDGVWNGNYNGDTVRVNVSGSNWTMEVLDNGSYVEYAKGTVTVGTVTASGTAITIMVTHVMDYGSEYGYSESSPMIPGEGEPIGPPSGGGDYNPGTEESTG